MTAALIVGACSMLLALGLFSARRADDQLTLLALVAGALNLQFIPRLRRVRGRVRTSPESDGVQVRVSAVGPSDGDSFLIECSLAPPLRMGLELAPLDRPGLLGIGIRASVIPSCAKLSRCGRCTMNRSSSC